jgi:hypothetical protein
VIFPRLAGERIADLYQRAFAATGALTVATLYNARQSAAEGQGEASCYATSGPAPEAVESAVPGVGRLASRDELIRMGAIPLPTPERLI